MLNQLLLLLPAADWITWGVGKGAEKAGELLKAGSEKFRGSSPATEEPRKIDPRVQQGVQYARVATKGAVKVTGYLGELIKTIKCKCLCKCSFYLSNIKPFM